MSFNSDLSTELDQVRLKAGDSNTQNELVADATINALLAAGHSVQSAAIETVRAILGILAPKSDTSAVGISTTRTQKYAQYQQLLSTLMSSTLPSPTFGGRSASDKDSIESNTDFAPSPFSRDRNRNPG